MVKKVMSVKEIKMIDKSKRGFTLIELFVVIVIIGILVAISIPNYIRFVDKARVASLMSNMRSVQLAVEMISVDSGKYPADVAHFIGRIPGNIKNPFNPTSPFLQDEGAENIPGVVEYEAAVGRDYYTIWGIGKNKSPINLIINP